MRTRLRSVLHEDVARDVQRRALAHGVLVERCGSGGEVLKVMPPINTPTDQLLEGLDRVETAITG